MGRQSCVLETSPRISGRLWGFDGNQTKSFNEVGVSSVEAGEQGKILEVNVRGGERVVGAEFNSENQAVLWTEKGNIYKLIFGQNRYWKVGKPGVVSCASFQQSPPNHLLVGLATGRAVVIDTDTGAIRARFVENCDILSVGGSHDGLLVFTQCKDHVTVWDITTKQARLRLGLQPGASLEFVKLVGGGTSYGYKVILAAKEGKIAIWGMKEEAGKTPGDKLDLFSEVRIEDSCKGFTVTGDNLYIATQTGVTKVDIDNGETEKIVDVQRSEKILGLDVKVFGTQIMIVLHLERKSVFLRNGEIVDEVYSVGTGYFSADGFLMGKVKPAGSVEFYRTDSSWNKVNKKVALKTDDKPAFIAKVVTANMSAATVDTVPKKSVKKAEIAVKTVKERHNTDIVDAAVKKGVNKAGVVDINKAERDYDELLSQINSPTLLPLLRSGLLSYPPLPRPTIWANLLHLPRNKRTYLKFCKLHDSSPGEVILNLLHWSPHLKLVPHLRPFISPFLQLFSGHPTTSFEFCLSILTKYTWLSSYPSSPPMFSLAWSILSTDCPSLTNHLSSISVNSRTLFWPLLQAGWSTVLPNKDWAKLWDHFITAGPELMVTALPATICCLKTILLSCDTCTMVDSLLSSQPALNMDELLNTAYSLLDNHLMRVNSVLQEKAIVVITDAGYPPPIKLEREGREVLKDLNTSPSTMSASPTLTLVNEKPGAHYSRVVREALAVSPPPIPRARSNQRAELSNKENIVSGFSSFQPMKQIFDPLAPLAPAYPPTAVLPDIPVHGEETGWEDITALLQKAKLLRQVIQAKK